MTQSLFYVIFYFNHTTTIENFNRKFGQTTRDVKSLEDGKKTKKKKVNQVLRH